MLSCSAVPIATAVWVTAGLSAEERLRPRGVAAETRTALHELFQACNQARYAPHRSAQELTSLVARTQTVLRELQALKE